MAQDASNTIYRFKVFLRGIRPMIWRRIEVPSDFNFKQFHGAIQCSMGWRMCHNFGFRMHDYQTSTDVDIGNPISDDDDDEYNILECSSVKLSSFFTKEKQWAEYEYDFGDGWEHKVVLEKILKLKPGQNYPNCVDGKRACPPEDCGSLPGYKRHVEIVNNKKHEEYEEHKDWLKYIGYTPKNPEDFDPKKVSFRMMGLNF